MAYLDPVYLIGMGISFILGASSYIIIMFWIRPIAKYRKIKAHIAADLNLYEKSSENSLMEKIREAVRKHSVNLSDSYTLDIPLWYRMVLDNRGEFPVDASKHLMKLSNTKTKEHFNDRIKQVRQALKL